MTTTTIVIVLELDALADCPSGHASVAGGERQAFHGWLGLATAIDALTQADDPGTDPYPFNEGAPT
jgi:hypothetical protein